MQRPLSNSLASPSFSQHDLSVEIAAKGVQAYKSLVIPIGASQMDPSNLVSTFNSLPRKKLTPSGTIPNHWHISLRHVPLNPTGQLLFIINPGARYVQTAGPLPQTAEDVSLAVRATALAMLLIKAFNDGLGAPQQGGSTMGRPWTWVCNDAELAGAMGETLRGMGVQAPEGMGIAEETENTIADEEWNRFFGMLQGSLPGTSSAKTGSR